ncbi:MAG TPA: AAC(3) family N-acetyltransferase [Chloroflexia bacterium]|nr:AAC(3) family N-acetyltransferase [Chloroflexia bacterium]
MEIVTKEILVSNFDDLGLKQGHKVLVHSSLSSFGQVERGAETVIDSLLETVGPTGTVLVPTLTGNSSLSPANPPVFDPDKTSCRTGLIPETFRHRPEAIRSLHPTHSVAAIGKDASSLTRDHFYSISPCDELSPYGKLAQMTDSYILLIGVDHQRSTMFHHVEEVAGVDYHVQRGFARATLLLEGKEVYRHILLHQYGTPRDFNVMEPVFEERGLQKRKIIGQAMVRLVKVDGMVETTLRSLRANPRILCKPENL